jgi:toxin-antitoxin system PIN domain toxin
MKVVDANILLHAVNQSAAEHVVCRQWLEESLSGDELIGLDWIVVLAFLRISTQPRIFPQPLSVSQAIEQIAHWLSSRIVQFIHPNDGHWDALSELLAKVGMGGNLTTDAHLAALAISRDATLVSCDRDFARFGRLKWENPCRIS